MTKAEQAEKLAVCGQQVKRLTAKSFFPSTPEGKAELAYTLDRFTTSAEHAIRVIDAAVIRRFGPEDRLEDRCPGPADLVDLCAEITETEIARRSEASMDCEFCHGDGYEDTGNGYKRCRCGGAPASNANRLHWARQRFKQQPFDLSGSGKVKTLE